MVGGVIKFEGVRYFPLRMVGGVTTFEDVRFFPLRMVGGVIKFRVCASLGGFGLVRKLRSSVPGDLCARLG